MCGRDQLTGGKRDQFSVCWSGQIEGFGTFKPKSKMDWMGIYPGPDRVHIDHLPVIIKQFIDMGASHEQAENLCYTILSFLKWHSSTHNSLIERHQTTTIEL